MTSQPAPVFRRILLKLSGEALMGDAEFGIDPRVLDRTAAEVRELVRLGVEVGLVVGGGNLFRGAALQAVGLNRVTGDHMGMLATVMNALAMDDALRRAGVRSRVMSALALTGVAESYDRRHAKQALSTGEVVVFAAGTGNPFFTTDSAACLRGIEGEADLVLKATKVDGVYSADPKRDSTATRFDRLSFDEVIARNLGVMDLTAICLCRDHNMPLRVFDMGAEGVLMKLMLGEQHGTLVHRG